MEQLTLYGGPNGSAPKQPWHAWIPKVVLIAEILLSIEAARLVQELKEIQDNRTVRSEQEISAAASAGEGTLDSIISEAIKKAAASGQIVIVLIPMEAVREH